MVLRVAPWGVTHGGVWSVDMGVTLNKGFGLAVVVVKCVVGAAEVRATQPRRSGAASQEC